MPVPTAKESGRGEDDGEVSSVDHENKQEIEAKQKRGLKVARQEDEENWQRSNPSKFAFGGDKMHLGGAVTDD